MDHAVAVGAQQRQVDKAGDGLPGGVQRDDVVDLDVALAELAVRRSEVELAHLAGQGSVGAQDGLVYDGGGFIFQNGRLVHEAPRFAAGTTTAVVDLDRTRRLRMEHTTWRADCEHYLRRETRVPVITSTAPTADTHGLTYPAPAGGSFFLPPPSPPAIDARDAALDELYEALATGVASYYTKTGAFRSLGLALSGGRDSMLTLLVAWRAAAHILGVGADAGPAAAGRLITAFYMPTRHSQDATRTAAHELATALGVALHTIPLDDAYDREVEVARQMLGGQPPGEMTRQNVQARLRGQRMWNWANTSGALFLQTGDMSEKAVGYTTIGGDLEGSLSVIANVPKTVVEALLARLDRRFGFAGIASTLATAPGPELADAQVAEHELMPFPILDACLHLYASEKLAEAEVAQALVSVCPGYDPAYLATCAQRFARLFTQSIYKWVQSPLALHVGSLDLDRERALHVSERLVDSVCPPNGALAAGHDPIKQAVCA